MKILFLTSKYVISILTLFLFSILPTFATDFDFGTQFGISRLVSVDEDDGTTLTYTRFPSGSIIEIGNAPTSLYGMFYPHKNIGLGPEFSYGVMSVTQEYYDGEDTESISTLHLGGRVAYYLMGYDLSSPYLMGRVAMTQYSGDDEAFFFDGSESVTGIGVGLGYQILIKSVFVLRVEGQFNRLSLSASDDDIDLNEYGLTISIGTRFSQ